MTREDIMRMAREAGFEVHDRKQQARVGFDALLGIDSTDKLKRFAALVAAAEREALAKHFEHLSGTWFAEEVADEIRSKGSK